MFLRYAAFLVLGFSFVIGVVATVQTHRGVHVDHSGPVAAGAKRVG